MTEIVSQRRSRAFALASAPEQSLELAWGAGTDVGLRRAANEDSLVAMPGVYSVADGLGGHAAGDVASAAAVASLERLAKSRSRRRAILDEDDVVGALKSASAEIVRLTRGALHGSGTTVTGIAVVAHEGVPTLQIFNIGDSRVYAFHDHVLTQLTIDHSYVQELVDLGQITPEQAEVHPDGNIITRALGFGEMPEVDRWLLHPQVGTRFLICSDGLTRELTNSTIGVLLGMGGDPDDTVRALIDAAVAAGGRDNVTVVVLDVLAVPDAVAPWDAPVRVFTDTGEI